MKKQTVSNGTVRDAPNNNDFLKRLEETKSAVDFYNLKDAIIEKLKKNTECD